MTSVDVLRTPAALMEAERWTAHNYHPLPVVIADADGAWVTSAMPTPTKAATSRANAYANRRGFAMCPR